MKECVNNASNQYGICPDLTYIKLEKFIFCAKSVVKKKLQSTE